MGIKHSLKQRIVMVFALMSVLVAGVFAVGIIATVHVVEKRLTTASLGRDLHRLMVMDNVENWSHKPEKEELFYVDGGAGELAMVGDLTELTPGFHEVYRGEKAYYAMAEIVGGRRYVLLRDQRNFEKREKILFGIVFVGFILSILLAILLGRLLARRVMAPVVNLSRQVRYRDQILELAPALSPNYARDEVGELAVSFDATLGRLHAALVREKLFTSDVSHELRTPLMVLASSCELLLESSLLDDRSRNQVRRIARASAGMSQLVETFLMLARVEGNESRHGPRSTLLDIAEELVDLWRKPIAEKGLELVFDPGKTLPTLFNATLVHSVMGNLLRNAWHYTDAGFIRLTLNPHGFTVEDSGIGIPESLHEAMFQPFVRGDEQRGEGLGLGLSLVQRICDNQHWSVTLRSLEPSGCCFEVVLDPVPAPLIAPVKAV
ncbi:HAMP domain-containing sensor histidine kinase [Pseudomonas sp. CCI3.2]|uniref:sensor histidine kinase n=1 Tax=unclassified Pseudomonas TaxID=196821 RepID=UPI002AC96D24|nr:MULTISPECIES: HAMP domain-containing sensor histidine kinase [unclassified Pseudomonas]MEB0078196.1 HAMP domain-containing sensor histidine kinase [Pseudomonas sp. MH10out]MEB0093081.1 HAMP domain-containing sensor histidine kinase [Pseudomonas sp. CCI4.2]MEB0100042.1 HAMP domain-containing sensor histidine kinase [Pseudomonas sp. CCI3.2]MEB0129904.1 HAMP domain-containing sensor histidine kinase [Pseudomonas sp. CCI2.4]MEB0157731.1 HAMP domain-containing sensor histidine kinase [Pseudomona